MGAEYLGYLIGALIGTGLITGLILWPLQKFLQPPWAVVIANSACLLLTSATYDRGVAAGLTKYGLPQAVWLIILLIVERGRKGIASVDAPPGGNRQRIEPRFDGEYVPSDHAKPDVAEQPVIDTGSGEISSPASPRDPRAALNNWNLISNHWNGLYSLGVSCWVFGLLIAIASGFGVVAIRICFGDGRWVSAQNDFFLPLLRLDL